MANPWEQYQAPVAPEVPELAEGPWQQYGAPKPVAGPIGQAFEQAGQNIGQSLRGVPEYALGQTGQALAGLESRGQAAYNIATEGVLGAAADIIGEAVQVPVTLAGLGFKNTVPTVLEDFVKNNVSNVVTPILNNSKTVEGLKTFATKNWQEWKNWEKTNPNDADTIKGSINVAEFFKPPQLRNPVVNKAPTFLGATADKLYESGVVIETKKSRGFLHKLAAPIETFEIAKERAKRKAPNKWGTLEYTPREDEEEVVSALMELNLNPTKSETENGRVVLDAVERKHDSLNKKLEKSDIFLDKEELIGSLEALVDDLDLALVGDAEASYKKFLALGTKFINETDGSVASILEVRRKLDNEIKKLGAGGNNWTDAAANGRNIAVRTIRDHLNLSVAESVPDIDVLKDLRKQHLWLRAADNIYDKAASNADLAIGRSIQNVARATGTTVPATALSQYALLSVGSGAVGYGLGAEVLPLLTVLAGIGTAGYVIKRGAVSPAVRKGLSGTLRSIDEAIKTTKNTAMAKSLAADRALIVELMKLPTTDANDEVQEEEETKIPLRPKG